MMKDLSFPRETRYSLTRQLNDPKAIPRSNTGRGGGGSGVDCCLFPDVGKGG
jgi:hypothetical protein